MILDWHQNPKTIWYKKNFFNILSGFLLISALSRQERAQGPLYQVKHFIEIGYMWYQKICNFALISNMLMPMALKNARSIFSQKDSHAHFLNQKMNL